MSNLDNSTIQLVSGSTVTFAANPAYGGISVLILPPGATSKSNVLAGAPKISALVTHDRGLDWPDAKGRFLAQEAIKDGGYVELVFRRKRDAEACRRRLEASAPK